MRYPARVLSTALTLIAKPQQNHWQLFSQRRILIRHMEALTMPLTGPVPEGRSFFCPHCGALYSVTHSRVLKSDTEKCVVCQAIMDKGEATKGSVYKLVHRPEDA